MVITYFDYCKVVKMDFLYILSSAGKKGMEELLTELDYIDFPALRPSESSNKYCFLKDGVRIFVSKKVEGSFLDIKEDLRNFIDQEKPQSTLDLVGKSLAERLDACKYILKKCKEKGYNAAVYNYTLSEFVEVKLD